MSFVQPCCLLKKKGWWDLKLIGSVAWSVRLTHCAVFMYIQLNPYITLVFYQTET
jgi:hypothetical protein